MTGQIVSIIEHRARTRYVESALAVFTLAWGLWLLGPWATFPSSPGFAVMAQIAPESLWGAIITLIGGVALALHHAGRMPARRIANAVAAALWLLLALGFIVANPTSTAALIYSLVAAQHIILFVWLNQEAQL